MEIVLVPALALTLATLFLAGLVWLFVLMLKGRPKSFWPRTLWIHLFLLVVHTTLTIPLAWGFVMPRFMVQTRRDEAGYRGPRIGADGTWQIQSRESLKVEAQDEALAKQNGTTPKAQELNDAAAKLAVHFTASDEVPLRGFLVPSRRTAPRFVAVLTHGLFRGACELETVGSMLRDAGGEVLLLEMRNHGGSGRAQFGKGEAKDVVAAVSFLRARPEARDRPLILFGVSLGTFATMVAAPRIDQIAGVILDAPIDDLRAVGDRMLGGLATRRGFGPDIPAPMRALILFSAEHLGGLDFKGNDSGAALCQLSPKIPILLIGAGKDDRVPPEAVQALYARLRTEPAKKQIWLVDAASHGKVWEAEPAEYRKRLASFLDLSVGPEQ